MPFVGRDGFETDFVYIPKGGDDFKSVHIEFRIPKGTMIVTIFSDEPIEDEDLSSVISSFQKDTLDKTEYNIATDSKVFLNICDDVFQIKLELDTFHIIERIPID